MIQQIANTMVSQKPQVSQTKKDSTDGAFASLLQQSGKTVAKENTKQTVSASSDDEKRPDTTDETNKQDAQPNLSPFASIFQAPVSVVVPEVPPTQGETQSTNPLPCVSSLQADPKQTAQLQSSGTQIANPGQENAVAGKGLLQSNGKPDVPATQIANSNSAADLMEASVQKLDSAFNGVLKSTLQEKSNAAAEPSKNGLNNQTQPTAVSAEFSKQDSKVTPKQESAPAIVKSDEVLKPEEQIATELSTSQSSKLQTAEDKNETIPIEAASQSQNARLSSLYENGNVVIKISDAKASGKAIGNQLTDKVLYNYKQGNQQFQMELYPQNLGKVSVKLAMQDGVLNVTIQAANPKTQSLLMENSADIKAILQTSVNQPVQIHETAQEHAWYQQNQQNQQNQPQQDREQKQSVQLPLDDSNGSTDDFITVMQQLRKQISAM